VRRAEIVRRRLAGEATEAETNEAVMLGQDLDALAALLAKAKAEAAALVPDAQQNTLSMAEAAWLRHQREVQLAALVQRVKAHEAAFTGCLAEAAALCVEAGQHDFRAVWQPSPALTMVMRHSRPATLATLRSAS
jgi:hypothetical protein